jgi:hypothetical protein
MRRIGLRNCPYCDCAEIYDSLVSDCLAEPVLPLAASIGKMWTVSTPSLSADLSSGDHETDKGSGREIFIKTALYV